MSDDLAARFEAAVTRSRELDRKPDNPTLLKMYALYKQASEGDPTEARPGATDFVARAKWDAWKRLAGTPADAARQQYIDLIDKLHADQD